ncbi:ABC transporter substrate-binding protein [Taylorella equigenitalis]|uniref:ABC transporter substrate-binding protein n=1 Tax=Taylorella equigenitalis TaxID=29575 RepID=UPI00237E9DDF|nr:ABC transporter substrate-binding protein [Taylorella equigenitalis]WDU52279.1 ABC transporter substrate-binding protein [Taylorella equigenitalis]
MNLYKSIIKSLIGTALVACASISDAQDAINIGVTVSATGPAASLGIPQKNTVEILKKEIKGVPVNYIVLDDAGDTSTAVKNMHKLISENHIDAIIGSSVTAASLAMVEVAAETKTPMISMNGNVVVVTPQEGAKKWAFKTAQNDALMAQALKTAMLKLNVKKLAIIGFADAYGESWAKEMKAALKDSGIDVVAIESFARKDTSVTGQVLKILSSKPDAVLVATSGTPGALPNRELRSRGFQGLIFHTHGSGNGDFLRVCATACDDVILPIGPVVVAEQLVDDHPSKKIGLEYRKLYDAKFGEGATNAFGAFLYDATLLVESSVTKVLEVGLKPGTEEFRVALRDALEQSNNVVASQGVFNMTPEDHTGLDERSRVIVKVKDGKWVLQPDLLK